MSILCRLLGHEKHWRLPHWEEEYECLVSRGWYCLRCSYVFDGGIRFFDPPAFAKETSDEPTA